MTNRRAALKTLLLAALAACDSAVDRLKGRKLVQVATADRIPPGGGYRTKVGDQEIILVNDGRQIKSFIAVCTHEGCPLGWNPNQHLIRCPCHGSAFDMSGKVVDGPAPLPLTEVETFVRRGNVLVVKPA